MYYERLLKQYRPMPRFILDYYREGQDLYSEGDIEDKIIELIMQNDIDDYERIILQNYSWSTYYHLTLLRKNILNWYPFSGEGNVLEIGCGMGAITNMLCEKCKKVTAVELSKRRAFATLLRCRNRKNLDIIVGNLNNIRFQEKYDYITLIGVLEYQNQYTNTGHPFEDFLRKIKSLLKPDGKVLIAIENKYGLKYWCGAPEDHTGVPFDSINQYEVGNKNAVTFSREELRQLIQKSGFSNTYFYYPLPDYKIPTVIYSEDYLPTDENLQNMIPYYTNSKTLIADERALYKDVVRNNVFEFFANSFLVECSDNASEHVTFASVSCERQNPYQIITRIFEKKRVEKIPFSEKTGMEHLKEMYKYQNQITQFGRKAIEYNIKNNCLSTEYYEYSTLEQVLVNLYRACRIDEIYFMYQLLYEDIQRSSKHISMEQNIVYSLKLDAIENGHDYGIILQTGYLDMIPRNAFWHKGELLWFDQEWVLENVPASFVLWCAFTEFYSSYNWASRVIPLEILAEHFALLNIWNVFSGLRKMFFEAVTDPAHQAVANVTRCLKSEYCIDNIRKLIS